MSAAAPLAAQATADRLLAYRAALVKRYGGMSPLQVNQMYAEARKKDLKAVPMFAKAVQSLVEQKVDTPTLEFVMEAMRPRWLGLELPPRVRGLIALEMARELVARGPS